MFDGKIDFMDFNTIKINYGGKLTCRKIFKKRFIIVLIISIIILILLTSFYAIKNRKITGISIEIKEIEGKNEQIDNNIYLLKNKYSEEDLSLIELQKNFLVVDNEVNGLNKKEDETKKKNSEIKSEKDNLEKQTITLNTQLKTEMELKQVYEQKISSLTALLESLKIEYEKLLEQKGDKKDEEEEDPLSIENSKIINSIEAVTIEKKIKGKIAKKCFDGINDKFSPEIFHERCDGSPLLVLIKTDNKERIGAFTKVSMEGREIKRDPSSALFNIDQGIFYTLISPEYSTIVCDPNGLPQYGEDLQIKPNGVGINSFPFYYGDKTQNFSEELTKNKVFEIVNLEIYKVDL